MGTFNDPGKSVWENNKRDDGGDDLQADMQPPMLGESPQIYVIRLRAGDDRRPSHREADAQQPKGPTGHVATS